MPPWHQRIGTVDEAITIVRPTGTLPEPTLYHDNDACEEGQKAPLDLRDPGWGDGLDRCPLCAALD